MARDPSRNAHQAHVLYAWHQQQGHSIERTARRLNLAPRTVYAMTANEITAPICIVGQLWDMTGSERLVNDLIGPTDRPGCWVALPQVASGASETQAACALMAKAGHVLETTASALSDGRIDQQERDALLPQLDELQRKIEAMKAALKGPKT